MMMMLSKSAEEGFFKGHSIALFVLCAVNTERDMEMNILKTADV